MKEKANSISQALEVACPYCGALVGEWCVYGSGDRRPGLHLERKKAGRATASEPQVMADGVLGDKVPLMALCPECKEKRFIDVSRAWLKQALESGEEVRVFSLECDHGWNLSPKEKVTMRKRLAQLVMIKRHHAAVATLQSMAQGVQRCPLNQKRIICCLE